MSPPWEMQPMKRTLTVPLGKADWLYDPETDTHVPCCTQISEEHNPKAANPWWPHKCGNGPLTGDQIEAGDCGRHS